MARKKAAVPGKAAPKAPKSVDTTEPAEETPSVDAAPEATEEPVN